MIRIAVLDDNVTHLQMIELALVGDPDNWDEPVELLTFDSGLALLNSLKTEDFDCVILDRNVPDMSGDVVLQWIRQYRDVHIPVVMVTSNKAGSDVVELLNAGADEYVTKPFYPAELLVRVKRLIENSRAKNEAPSKNEALVAALEETPQKTEVFGVIFDDFSLTINHASQLIKLTELEYNLAKLFFNNVGVNLSREFILQRVWMRDNKDAGRSLTTHIHRIRDKLELTAENGWALRPVYGYGYRLDYFKKDEQ
ncbi:response regulator transcription factor [Hydromonas duriensis]|uniref:DNA-binding response OmpR family regulator n=1 Tax=Hydromonas duriensis TaxID=1527608 RepID=A0A4R6Y7X0_9BURK|nr:response regulator transcription factor [Hydromonas duriensis]TDR31437.1 DNA-binding response OmpR family regulator [Hydromonas duriensis]